MSCWVDAIKNNMTDKQFADSIGRTKGAANQKMKQINDRLRRAGFEPLPRLRSENSYRSWEEVFEELHKSGVLMKRGGK